VARSQHIRHYVDYAISNDLVRMPYLAYAAIPVSYHPGKQEPARNNLSGGQPCESYYCQSPFMVLATALMQEIA
jgi:hypothetical protein